MNELPKFGKVEPKYTINLNNGRVYEAGRQYQYARIKGKYNVVGHDFTYAEIIRLFNVKN